MRSPHGEQLRDRPELLGSRAARAFLYPAQDLRLGPAAIVFLVRAESEEQDEREALHLELAQA